MFALLFILIVFLTGGLLWLGSQWRGQRTESMRRMHDYETQHMLNRERLEHTKKDCTQLTQELLWHQKELQDARAQGIQLEERLKHQTSQYEQLRTHCAAVEEQQQSAWQNWQNAQQQCTKLEMLYEQAQQHTEQQKKFLTDVHQQFSEKFENLTQKIFEEQSRQLSTKNNDQLSILLSPLRENLKDLQENIKDTYDRESRERFSLTKEVTKLAELSTKVGDDANQLAQALRSNHKIQGNWGELILENILEYAGLRRDQDYWSQKSVLQEGDRLQPDIIIRLPDHKHIIIDAKVSLVDFEKYLCATTKEEIKQATKKHTDAIRQHIRSLSKKNYQILYTLASLDFVLLFIPIEPAYLLALSHDDRLFQDAWQKNIVLVSPTNLLATLRTVAALWKQERQNRNAHAIAHCAGLLYDKFVHLLADLEEIGHRLAAAQTAHARTIHKLQFGRGNLLHHVEHIKSLGIQTGQAIPDHYLSGEESRENGRTEQSTPERVE